MARINLLPWREELRQEKKKEFLSQLAGVCVLALLVCYIWVNAVTGMVDSQTTRNNILQNEIKLLEAQVQEIQDLKKARRELLDRMSVIQGLEGTRAIIVHYVDEFAMAVPDGVYMTSLIKKGDLLSFTGVAESNNRLSTFMRQLEASDWFADVNLRNSGASRDGGQSGEFSMNIRAVLPQSEEDGSDG